MSPSKIPRMTGLGTPKCNVLGNALRHSPCYAGFLARPRRHHGVAVHPAKSAMSCGHLFVLPPPGVIYPAITAHGGKGVHADAACIAVVQTRAIRALGPTGHDAAPPLQAAATPQQPALRRSRGPRPRRPRNTHLAHQANRSRRVRLRDLEQLSRPGTPTGRGDRAGKTA